MRYSPRKTTGLAIGLSALAALLGLVALSVVVLITRPLAWPTFLALCVLLIAAPLVMWVAYRCVGLASARYQLDRNALAITWGERREVIPLEQLEDIHLASEFEGELRPRGLNWPGCIVSRIDHPQLGAVEFLATSAEKAGLVMLGYPGGWLAISPPDPAGFVSALQTQQAEPVDARAEAQSRWPALPGWALWQDRLALGLAVLGGLGLLALAGYLMAVIPNLPSEIALRFNAQGRPLEFGPPNHLLILPALGAAAWLLNTFLGALLYRRAADRLLTYLLLATTIVVSGLAWAAALGLLTAGRPA